MRKCVETGRRFRTRLEFFFHKFHSQSRTICISVSLHPSPSIARPTPRWQIILSAHCVTTPVCTVRFTDRTRTWLSPVVFYSSATSAISELGKPSASPAPAKGRSRHDLWRVLENRGNVLSRSLIYEFLYRGKDSHAWLSARLFTKLFIIY